MAAYTTIDFPQQYFQVKTYTGNGGAQTIALDNTDADTDPDLIWIKRSDGTTNHVVTDTVRTVDYQLHSNTTDADSNLTNNVTSTNADGFVVNTDGEVNADGGAYVAWCWKESATSGFDIVAWTGNDTARTLSHSLSAVPEFIMLKQRSGTRDWAVYNVAKGNGQYMNLNAVGGSSASSTHWNSTTPTSSVFSVGTSNQVNEDTETYVGYLFAPKQGFSKFGAYTGNGDDDGPMIHLGFSPAWFMLKSTSTNESWYIQDNQRGITNGDSKQLLADGTGAESATSTGQIDFVSTGVKMREGDACLNESGTVYTYAAFAYSPFVNSEGVPNNAV